MLHYIRDLLIPRRPTADYSATHMIGSYVFYHFLRVMGWEWLWECDSQQDVPNHCPDGDMEVSGTASWLALGTGPAVLSKDASVKHQGLYALKVDSQGNADDGVRSSLLTNMENSVVYRIALWASNNTGSAWNVDVDTGTGSFTNVGTIPNNGGTWTLYHFTFTTNAGGSRYVRVVDNNATGGDMYLDDLNVFRSWFEYNGVDQNGSDGDVQNGDEFSSAGYTFVAGDVGKVVVFYDPTNLGNSGAYTVDSINAGNAVLALRMGGSETLINTAVGTLVWRLIDLTAAPISAYVAGGGSASESGAGWGLESPHASEWRLFFRHHAPSGSGEKGIMTWSAPIASDFSVMNGDFMSYDPSTLRPRGESFNWSSFNTTDGWFLVGNGGDNTGDTHKRLYAMVASGGEIASLGMRSVPELSTNLMGLFGLSGTDARHTARESFMHMAKRNGGASPENEMAFDIFSGDGACGTEETSMPPAALGFWHTEEDTLRESDAKANPFSGDEVIQRPLVLRDYDGDYGYYSEKEFDTEDALWGCRDNLTEFTPFSPIEGTNSAFSLAGSTITLTSNEALFTPEMVGREITISGATTPGNDGTFVITSYISTTQVTYENAGGATEAGAGTWSTSPQYMHFEQGVCWKWPGLTALA